jgi:hypothetical protein
VNKGAKKERKVGRDLPKCTVGFFLADNKYSRQFLQVTFEMQQKPQESSASLSLLFSRDRLQSSLDVKITL